MNLLENLSNFKNLFLIRIKKELFDSREREREKKM